MTTYHQRAVEAHMKAREYSDTYCASDDESDTVRISKSQALDRKPVSAFPWDLVIISLLTLGFLVGWVCGRTAERYSDEHRRELGRWPR